MTQSHLTAIRGRLLTFLHAPSGAGDRQSYRYMDDGIVLVREGRISAIGPASELISQLPPDVAVEHHPGKLIMPGFVDPHIHYPQTQVIASYGAQLLEWLEKYTFVEEQKFNDPSMLHVMPSFFSTNSRATARLQRSPIARLTRYPPKLCSRQRIGAMPV